MSTFVVDFEFCHCKGGNIERVYCLAWHCIETGKEGVYSEGELRRMPDAPFPRDALVVSYAQAAEASAYIFLGWRLPARVVDLHAEFSVMRNDEPGGRSMVEAARHFGIESKAEAAKEEMRELAMTGRDLTPDEARRMAEYCLDDVRDETRLFCHMKHRIHMAHALLRGQVGNAFALMRWRGVPVDGNLYERILEARPEIRRTLIEGEPLAQEVYGEEGTFSRERFWQLLVRRRWAEHWPLSAISRVPKTDTDSFKAMREIYPDVTPLARVVGVLAQLNNLNIPIGDDERHRPGGGLYGSRTGRTQPRASIFGKHKAFRRIIRAPEGYALVSADYVAQETAIAAALSGDKALQEDLKSDAYMRFAEKAALVPRGATKASHPKERAVAKTCTLGTLYGQGAESLAIRIGRPVSFARQLLRAHRREYATFHQWQAEAIRYAKYRGFIEAPLGWSMKVSTLTPLTRLKNWMMQATGAEMMRAVMVLSMGRGIEIVETVHDGFLFQVLADVLDEGLADIETTLREASIAVLDGYEVGVELDVIPPGHHYPIPPDDKIWGLMAAAIGEREVEHAVS